MLGDEPELALEEVENETTEDLVRDGDGEGVGDVVRESEVEVQRERRHEVSLLDLPRGRVHRKKKSSDGGFEWVGRKHGGGCDDAWEMETVGQCEAWEEVDDFDEEDEWEELEDGNSEAQEYDGRGQVVRARVLTYAEKVREKEG